MSCVMVDVILVLSFAMLLLDYARGDVCLACTDSPLTRECLYTMTCASHESCYADAFENPNGDLVFNLGCRDRQLCGSFGKREAVNRSNGNTQLCAQCCFGNLCNAALCGQTGLPSVGPVCFKCDQANTPSSCNTIALCGRDDVCHVEKTIGSLTHATLYKSGCLHKTNCDRHAQSLSLIGRKRYDNTVMSGNDLQIQCCDSNLCNHGNASSASVSASTTGAVAPTHSSLSTPSPAPTTATPAPTTPTPAPTTATPAQASPAPTTATPAPTTPTPAPTTATPAQDLDCSDIKRKAPYARSGTYKITSWKTKTKATVLCDMETGNGGWTVMQRRFSGRLNFYRNLSEYAHGFGSLDDEFWMGLDLQHELTSRGNHVLRIDVESMLGVKAFDMYANFSIGEVDTYVMNVGQRIGSIGMTESYRLDGLHGHAFTTYDRDLDTWDEDNCASYLHGAWWYRHCYFANLNGQYSPGQPNNNGMNYRSFDYNTNLMKSQMMFSLI